MSHSSYSVADFDVNPLMFYYEVTLACDLVCKHCRASAQEQAASDELSTEQAKALGLQVDMSVISSWDMGGPWIEPRHASMGLYTTETTAAGGTRIDLALPFPTHERTAPIAVDGRPAFWTDVAVLALRGPRRLPAHEFVLRLDPLGFHNRAAGVLDQGRPGLAEGIGGRCRGKHLPRSRFPLPRPPYFLARA